MMLSLIGKPVPPWIGVPSLAVIQSNVKQGYQDAWKKPLPAKVATACDNAADRKSVV